MERFELKKDFIEKYRTIKPPFGFNGLGEIVYLRTYSRLKPDGKSEEWHETVERVVNGVYNLQKEHIISHNLGWYEEQAHESAQEMYDRMFNMKFLPSGRSLWAMGTSIITEKKLFAALNACSFVSTENIDTEFTKPFEYMMDMEMLGVGVGFDVKGAGKFIIKEPTIINSVTYSDEAEVIYTIEDNREGWTKSLKIILDAFFKGEILPTFDYSQIRPEGTPIKTFGGKCPGYKPLEDLHKAIIDKLTPCISKPISITNIVDIMNMIGVCVVAGNIRKSAQIVFGDTSEEYLKLKDYRWNDLTQKYEGTNIQRNGYGWCSNNSIYATVGMDYGRTSEQTGRNGEPGFFWLQNARQYSRMNGVIDNKDSRAIGGNPCLEQTLESYEMCCLVETFPTRNTDIEDFKRTLKYAYLFAKTVTLGLCHWPETNRVQLRNRRIGTSVSGVAQFLEKNSLDTLKQWLTIGYETIRKYDDIYSEWLAIPKSIKVTSVKPSGTVSLLAGATPGIHFPESNYYIRRIRFAKNSDLIKPLVASGYKIEEATDNPETTVVVEIPVFAGNCKTVNQVTIWEQLLLASFLQEHWADNQVSCTVTFKEWERGQIKTALDYFQYKLKGVSFLPKTTSINYPQMPYEEITEEQYKSLLNNITAFNTDNITEDSKPELFCDNESCSYV
jgi:adenosylcobalamin-dependent ribonucleoside-triphosphate reductase